MAKNVVLALAVAGAVSGLLACDAGSGSETPEVQQAPAAAPEVKSRNELAFTLTCEGDYNFKPISGDLLSGFFRFHMTVEPRSGRYYMHDLKWGPSGTKAIIDQDREIRDLVSIDETVIKFQDGLTLNRDTGKLNDNLGSATGSCSRLPNVTPIPSGVI